jgi:hypothetical protein
VLEDRIGGVDGDLVVRLVAVLEPQVEVLDVELEIRQDKLGVELEYRLFGGEGVWRWWVGRGTQNIALEGDKEMSTTHLLPDLLPDDTRHLIAVELHHRVRNHDFLHLACK